MIIDAHAHFEIKQIVRNPDGFLEGLDKNNVDYAIGYVADLIGNRRTGWPDYWTARNKDLAEVGRLSRGRIFPTCTVNPEDRESALSEVRRAAREDNVVGIKLQPYSGLYNAYSEDMIALSRLAAELKLPMFIHCFFQPYVSPGQLGLLARECPDTTIVYAHGGGHNGWTAAVTSGRKYENIVMCTASCSFWGIKELVKSVGPDRVVLGSDFPCGGPRSERYEIDKIRENNFGKTVEDRILGGNIARILGLEVREC